MVSLAGLRVLLAAGSSSEVLLAELGRHGADVHGDAGAPAEPEALTGWLARSGRWDALVIEPHSWPISLDHSQAAAASTAPPFTAALAAPWSWLRAAGRCTPIPAAITVLIPRTAHPLLQAPEEAACREALWNLTLSASIRCRGAARINALSLPDRTATAAAAAMVAWLISPGAAVTGQRLDLEG